MLEIRIHGRGGQGAVVASRLIALSLFKEGYWVQSFPFFGAERRGAPITAFVRADREPILLRCQVRNPHIVIVLDRTLTEIVNITEGLREDGWIIVNTPDPFEKTGFKVATVDATKIALSLGLGSRAYPFVNTAIVGAFARATQSVSLLSVEEAVKEYITHNQKKNLQAVIKAFHETKTWT